MCNILKAGNRLFNNPWTIRIALLMGFAVQGFAALLEVGAIGDTPTPTWVNVAHVVFWSRFALGVLTWFALILFAFYLGIILITLNRIMATDNIKVEPYHPDGAGGFGLLGQFIANLGYLAFALAVVLIGLSWQTIYNHSTSDAQGWLVATITGGIVYMIIAPIFFFLPLNSTHRAMVRCRDRILAGISRAIDSTYQTVNRTVLSASELQIDYESKILNLQELKEYTLHYPTWPFSFGSLRKFYALVAGPVFLNVIGIVISQVIISVLPQ
jgi:hypothetical protein